MLSTNEFNEIYDKLKDLYVKREDIDENLCMEDVIEILRNYVGDFERQDI
jgi:hypothetical protein